MISVINTKCKSKMLGVKPLYHKKEVRSMQKQLSYKKGAALKSLGEKVVKSKIVTKKGPQIVKVYKFYLLKIKLYPFLGFHL